MVETTTCQECGFELPLNAPQGLCPRCLVGMGINLRVPEPPAGASISNSVTPRQDSTVTGKLREFADYELLEEIARGGMGVVYKARQKSLNRLVAVKMLLFGEFSSHEFVRRFRAEAEAVASLQHPNIVAIHEIGELDGQHYFSMDYVKGQNLSQLARDNPLPAEVAADYVRTVARAIEYAHQHGVLHRDLKPSNVLVDPLDRPRVTDFGLAKRLQDESNLTVSGQTLGTPSYMSPEQAAGHHRQIGIASDVYSLGALLYFLLTGRAPFLGEGLEDTLRQVLEAEPVAPRLLNPSIPKDLETICLKCLTKEPRGRYATAGDLADELARWMAGKPILARPAGRPEKIWRWCRRQPMMAGLICAVAILLLAGATGSTWMFMREKSARAYAEKLRKQSELHEANAQNEAAKLRRMREFLYKFLEKVPKIVTPADNTPAVLATLGEFSKLLADEFPDQPQAQAELRLELASIYHEMGFYEPMKDMDEATLQLVRERLGQQNPAFLTALSQLGDALMHLWKFPEAEAVSRQALALQKARFGAESEEAMKGLSLLGIVLHRGGKPSQAEAAFMGVMQIQRKLNPTNEVALAAVWENVALAWHDEQRLDESEMLLAQVLEIRRRRLGEMHPDIATSLHNLARTLYDEGRPREAEPMLAEALRLRRSAYGGEHPAVATSMYVQALVLSAEGKLSEAESTHREAMAIRCKRYGTEHPVVAESLDGLGTVLAQEGQLNEAETVLRDAFRIRRRGLGEQHPYVGESLGHLLVVLEQAGKPEEAERLVAELLSSHPVGPHILRTSANYFGRRSEWQNGVTQAAAALDAESSDYRNYCTLAPLLVASGATNRYNTVRAQMANEFGSNTNRVLVERTARASLILPLANYQGSAAISNWLASIGSIGMDNRFLGRFQLTRALAEYRLGHFADSVALAKTTLLRADVANPGEEAQAWLIIAMGQFQLNQAGQSKAAMTTASVVLESKSRRLNCGDLSQNWADYVTAYAMLDEAQGLLKVESNQAQALR